MGEASAQTVFLRNSFWTCFHVQGFFQQFWEKAPGQNWGKMIDLTSQLGEINDTEHNKGSKIFPQNQVLLDCICQAYHLSTSV